MADVFRAQCKVCGKEFKLRPNQLGREVRCPYCKAICKILPQTETAREAAEALRGEVPEHRPVTTHRQVVMPRGGVRHMSVAVVWVVLIGVVAIGLVVLLVVMARRPQPTAPTPGTAPGIGAVGAGGTPGAPAVGPSVAPTAEAVNLDIEKLVQGIQNGTRTYAVGTITNQTSAMIREVEVKVGILDDQEKELGRAEARVRDLKPGEKAPVVAVWEHDPAVRGAKYMPNYDIPASPPAGPPHDLVIEGEAWPLPDSGGWQDVGRVTVHVINRGVTAVNAVEMTAVMRGADGSIVGAARDVVMATIMPGKAEEIAVRYERCAERLIGSVQVRVQAAGQ